MGGEEDGLGFAEPLDELADFEFLVRVEAVGRLVEDQDFRVVKQRLGEAGAVAVAFGKRVDGLLGDGAEEAGVDGALDGVVFRGALEAADGGAEFEETDDRHVIVKRGGFRQVTDLGFRLAGFVDDRDSADFGVAGSGRDESGDHAHGGGLAGAVGSEESEDLAFFHREREMVHGAFGSELFGQVFDFDHGMK